MGTDESSSGMGVSSERTGHVGPRQKDATHGYLPTGPPESEPEDEPPEQHPGNPEQNPQGIPPKAGYPRLDPRHRE